MRWAFRASFKRIMRRVCHARDDLNAFPRELLKSMLCEGHAEVRATKMSHSKL